MDLKENYEEKLEEYKNNRKQVFDDLHWFGWKVVPSDKDIYVEKVDNFNKLSTNAIYYFIDGRGNKGRVIVSREGISDRIILYLIRDDEKVYKLKFYRMWEPFWHTQYMITSDDSYDDLKSIHYNNKPVIWLPVNVFSEENNKAKRKPDEFIRVFDENKNPIFNLIGFHRVDRNRDMSKNE